MHQIPTNNIQVDLNNNSTPRKQNKKMNKKPFLKETFLYNMPRPYKIILKLSRLLDIYLANKAYNYYSNRPYKYNYMVSNHSTLYSIMKVYSFKFS